jgi:AraC-like DNA-binding protein
VSSVRLNRDDFRMLTTPREWLLVGHADRWQLFLRQRRIPWVFVLLAIGCESEAAFSQAFKRQFGASPSNWRRQSDS